MKTVMAEDKYIFNNNILNNELTNDKRKYLVLRYKSSTFSNRNFF